MDEAQIRDADHPFSPTSDTENPSDLILLSMDAVRFYVHWSVLAYASVFFKDLQTLPAPSGVDADQTFDGKPVVPLTEPAVVVGKLLRLCYPRTSDAFAIADLDGIAGAYEAAKKYLILGGTANIEAILVDPRILDAQPHRVYAIAYHHGLEPIAKKAAMATLSKLPFDGKQPHPPEYEYIPAVALWRLLAFHQRCVDRLIHELKQPCYWQHQSQLQNPTRWVHPSLSAVWWRDEDVRHAQHCGPRYAEEDVGPAAWFSRHIDAVCDKLARCADVERITTQLSRISGETLHAISACPACAREAPDQLEVLARDVKASMKRELSLELTLSNFLTDESPFFVPLIP
ncbi:hypothetical protein MKEN_01455500 [Mycena kentingensis (nom. inval.)]|nr:hypothetical protein MKEN_01455500 [Mycena kentingensis (nom. inval.)]